MHPVLFRFHNLVIYSYGAMMAIGLITTWILATLHSEKFGIAKKEVENLLLVSILSGLIGAHFLYIIQYPDKFDNIFPEMLLFFHTGKVWYGGFLFAFLSGILYLKERRLHIMKYVDYIITYLPLAHAIGRIGCFLNGCCYGRPSKAWGMAFPGMLEPVIPTQLISSAFLFFLFFMLLSLRNNAPKKLGSGLILGAYLSSYGAFRLLIEFIRGDNVPVAFGLRFSQWVSIVAIIMGMFFLWKAKNTNSQ